MLEKIEINNFQTHSNLKINFDSGITTIVGATDVGKSAILRALKWVCLNVPGGDSFVKEGTKLASVELTVDGHTIKRQRGKSNNLYFLDGSEFKAFGSDVPTDIANIINAGPINFQGQHDPVFWFAESAGEVSRQLNAVVDLGVIDESLANIAGRVAHFRSAANVTKERMLKAKTKKQELEWVLTADKEYQEIESLQLQIDQKTSRIDSLRKSIQTIRDTEKALQTASQQVLEIREIGQLGNQARKLANRREQLAELLDTIKIQKATLAKPNPSIEPLKMLLDSYNEVWNRRMGLNSALKRIRMAGKLAEEAKTLADDLKTELDELTQGQCPICGGELK